MTTAISPELRQRLNGVRKTIDPDGVIIGSSDAILRVFGQIHECRPADGLAAVRSVLLLGETGTGKSTIANLLHFAWTGRRHGERLSPAQPGKPAGSQATPRHTPPSTPNPRTRGRPPHAAADAWPGKGPDEGARRGDIHRWQGGNSHTADPAIARGDWVGFGEGNGIKDVPPEGRPGFLQQFHEGTIFVDEVALLSREIQALLLDAAEGRPVQPIGGTSVPFEPDVRFVFATNEDVHTALRPDLLQRIDATITLPSLRDRREDVFDLARHLLAGTGYRLDFRTWYLLLRYDWPGNVREFKRVIADAVRRERIWGPDATHRPAPTTAAEQRPVKAVEPIRASNGTSPGSPDGPPLEGGPEQEPPQTRPSEKTVLPFETFLEMPEFSGLAHGHRVIGDHEAAWHVKEYLRERLEPLGYGPRSKTTPLWSRVAEILEIRPDELSRIKPPDGGAGPRT